MKYDIRGKFGKEINEDYAKIIGKKFVEYTNTKAEKAVVGYDHRLSSPILEKALVSKMNCTVIRLGLCTSPMLYFATKKLEVGNGIMITASHNPHTDNGFKLINDNLPICGRELKNMINGKFIKSQKTKHEVIYNEVKKSYIKDLLREYQCARRLKIYGIQEMPQ
ncbi:MAG: hypothetical protein HRK26_05645 [Rickettsiaceae bacterium H1]|nr:hypothetical protein [Rickettsiaceae bacterium H1]